MFPSPSIYNFTNRASIHSEGFGETFVRVAASGIFRSYFKNLSFCKNMRVLTFSFGCVFPSSLGKHIAHIFSVSASNQVFWIYARGIIAAVKDAWLNFFNCSTMNQKREAVGKLLVSKSNMSVSIFIFPSFPHPTRSVNVRAGNDCLFFNKSKEFCFKC